MVGDVRTYLLRDTCSEIFGRRHIYSEIFGDIYSAIFTWMYLLGYIYSEMFGDIYSEIYMFGDTNLEIYSEIFGDILSETYLLGHIYSGILGYICARKNVLGNIIYARTYVIRHVSTQKYVPGYIYVFGVERRSE